MVLSYTVMNNQSIRTLLMVSDEATAVISLIATHALGGLFRESDLTSMTTPFLGNRFNQFV
jgi:hypothetical protein